MGKILFYFFFCILLVFLLSGCVQQPQTQQQNSKTAEQYCKELCQTEKTNGTDFSNGPCLANPLQEAKDTVCDIAHNPRTAIDDLQENQCSAFRQGIAQHFVELNESCTLIKKY